MVDARISWRQVRAGARRLGIVSRDVDDQIRVLGVGRQRETVLVATDADAHRAEPSGSCSDAALVGCPLAIIAMALLTYWIVGRTLRPVAGLRHGAEEITAAGLSDQRLPVRDAPGRDPPPGRHAERDARPHRRAPPTGSGPSSVMPPTSCARRSPRCACSSRWRCGWADDRLAGPDRRRAASTSTGSTTWSPTCSCWPASTSPAAAARARTDRAGDARRGCRRPATTPRACRSTSSVDAR